MCPYKTGFEIWKNNKFVNRYPSKTSFPHSLSCYFPAKPLKRTVLMCVKFRGSLACTFLQSKQTPIKIH